VLRGTVRAEGWAEADKAEAQRKPGAKREHGIILGHAPRRSQAASPVAVSDTIPERRSFNSSGKQ
jgi:hypothetical protein